MKQLYLDIKTKLQASVPELLQISVYNNQFQSLEDRDIYSFPFPCAFVEFVNENESSQLGNGVQIFDPLYVKIHIGHTFYNGENQEENLDVFDLKDKIYKALQKFEPDGAVAFIRSSETQDYDHTDVYHFVQTYTTNYVDFIMNEPVDGQEVQPPFAIVKTITFNKNG
jgi:hypothetical protein